MSQNFMGKFLINEYWCVIRNIVRVLMIDLPVNVMTAF